MSAKGLEQSEKIVGQLRKVVLTPDGKVVDGFHRLEVNPEWGTETWENIKTEEDYWKTRAHLNYTRRNAVENRKEKLRIINSLAEYYVGQGLKTHYMDTYKGDGTIPPPKATNQILQAVITALDGAIPESWIRQNLDKKYRQKTPTKEPSPDKKLYRGTPEDAIRGRFGTGRAEHAEQVIEDFKTEMREDLREQVRAEVVEEVKEETKEELLKEPEFIMEAIERAPQVLTKRKVPVVDREGFYKPAVDERIKEEISETLPEVEEELRAIRESPESRDKARLLRAWRSLTVMLTSSKDLECPICNSKTVSVSIKCPKCGEIPLSEAARVAREAV